MIVGATTADYHGSIPRIPPTPPSTASVRVSPITPTRSAPIAALLTVCISPVKNLVLPATTACLQLIWPLVICISSVVSLAAPLAGSAACRSTHGKTPPCSIPVKPTTSPCCFHPTVARRPCRFTSAKKAKTKTASPPPASLPATAWPMAATITSLIPCPPSAVRRAMEHSIRLSPPEA